MNPAYIHYGCGLCAPSTWRNFDASPSLRIQRIPVLGALIPASKMVRFPRNVEYGDITKTLPVHPASCKAVYCSHVLEHLALDDFRTALRNTYSYLEAGGIFRFVLPDLELLARKYLGSENSQPSVVFMEDSHLGQKSQPRGIEGFLRSWLGHGKHHWMWDFKSIVVELEQVGFRNIRRATFNDSVENLFKDVESIHRWQDCLGIECVR